ncbi:hypothetical protein ABZ568_25970 [Streptomyces olindensis]|uniref:Uncharacterized protein n=1 Tax=Streptomyces olindensis TaxID=358823 RepID=A0ABV2Y0L0_9ACTN
MKRAGEVGWCAGELPCSYWSAAGVHGEDRLPCRLRRFSGSAALGARRAAAGRADTNPHRAIRGAAVPVASDHDGCIAAAEQDDVHLTDSSEALRVLITEIKAGRADHLL